MRYKLVDIIQRRNLEKRLIALGFCHNYEERKNKDTTKFFKTKINPTKLGKAMGKANLQAFISKIARKNMTVNFYQEIVNFLNKFEAEKNN